MQQDLNLIGSNGKKKHCHEGEEGKDLKYTYPESMMKQFIQFCEDSYAEKIQNKKGTYIDKYGDEKYTETMVKFYIAFFIMYAFDERIYERYSNDNIEFPTFINNSIDDSIKAKLNFFLILAKEKRMEHHYRCHKIIRQILANKEA